MLEEMAKKEGYIDLFMIDISRNLLLIKESEKV